MNRSAKAGEWPTNVSLGGSVADGTADLPERAIEIARDAKAAIGLDFWLARRVVGLSRLHADGPPGRSTCLRSPRRSLRLDRRHGARRSPLYRVTA
ncbi:hypothetical protein [Halovenus sp. HT40]|uniref:hypothetical protein n=1 Tax=Halovenus sp. HT40 TaxID=3126691 RepID=UPI00300EF306